MNYSTEEDPLPPGHAATHIGIFLAWAVLNGLAGDWHRLNSTQHIERLQRREITGAQFFFAVCGDRFSEKDLNPEGNLFTRAYYENGPGKRGLYFKDYAEMLSAELPSFWHVEDTWENFDLLAPIITQRFETWKNPPRKKWWQFWKRE
jgi:hypothetical protein